jgi:hypothetical protein
VVTVSVAWGPAGGAAPETVFATVSSHRDVVGAVMEISDEARPHDNAHHESTHARNSRARIARVDVARRLPCCCRGNG